ncbi:hypothetical protein PG994_008627 [Apiospora phragmitis]|uniref:Uncharacterized protein n=1 Tax=Apiospora phragmitis TaxID=2905665 RepID=A0ABR1UH04_9PEZI
MKGAVRTTILRKLRSSSPVWVINAVIRWGNAAVAHALRDKLNQAWLETGGSGGDRSIIASGLFGVNQNIQIQRNLNDNSSMLRQSLISSAAKVLSTTHGSQGIKDSCSGSIDGSGMPLIVPEVNVTKSQLVYLPGPAKKL